MHDPPSERLRRSSRHGSRFRRRCTRGSKAGRVYGKEKTGDFSIRFAAGTGVLFDNAIDVPAEYNAGASLGACGCSFMAG